MKKGEALLYTVLIAASLLTGSGSVAQPTLDCLYSPPREAETWCFYSSVKLEFRNGQVIVSRLPSTLGLGKGCSAISDASGNLVMYSDGMKLWDSASQIISNTMGGDLGSTQSSLIVPHPAVAGRYFIFTTDLLYPPPLDTKGLSYSVCEIKNGQGSIMQMPRRLLVKTAEKLTGVKHGNGTDYWVVAHDWGNDSFVSFRISAQGLDTIPVVSHAGSVYSGDLTSRNPVGYMKLSPDGSKLAAAILGAGLIEWFDFDNNTGIVSNVRQIPSPDAGKPYGIEFSPDSDKLYFTTVEPTTNTANNLYQVDLPGTTPVKISSLAHDFTALQLAVDGKIYVARYNQPYIALIQNPNRPDTACNLAADGLFLAGGKSLLGLPNFVQSYLNIPAVNYETRCFGDATTFRLTNESNIDSISWDFGDAASGLLNTDMTLQPVHVFSADGDFDVSITEWFNGRSFQSSLPVHINKLPDKSFMPDSLYILPGSEIRLDAGNDMKYYQWQDGSGLQYYPVSQAGYYSVYIVDKNCCQQSDTIKIILLDLAVPSAFSPNGDGLNDRFRAKGPAEGIRNFHLAIYNRWGQLMWETNSIEDTWDGKSRGKECPAGVYMWVMKFSAEGNLLKKDNISKTGSVTIVR